MTERPGGAILPVAKLQPGVQLSVDVTVRRSGWLGWLVGKREQVHATLRTPTAMVTSRLIHLACQSNT